MKLATPGPPDTDRRAAPPTPGVLYLATASTPTVRHAMRCGQLGQMVTPNAGNYLEPDAAFGIDNGAYGGRWTERRWRRCLERYAEAPGGLFAVVPDAVADAAETDRLWRRWAPVVAGYGYRPAYVIQDGCAAVPCDADAAFNGGTTEHKEGPAAQALIADARRRGLWCHMGRVNSLRRLRLAALDGYHSVDGTYLAYGPDRNLPRLLGWLQTANQPHLFQ
jgi:hypothetical protein